MNFYDELEKVYMAVGLLFFKTFCTPWERNAIED